MTSQTTTTTYLTTLGVSVATSLLAIIVSGAAVWAWRRALRRRAATIKAAADAELAPMRARVVELRDKAAAAATAATKAAAAAAAATAERAADKAAADAQLALIRARVAELEDAAKVVAAAAEARKTKAAAEAAVEKAEAAADAAVKKAEAAAVAAVEKATAEAAAAASEAAFGRGVLVGMKARGPSGSLPVDREGLRMRVPSSGVGPSGRGAVGSPSPGLTDTLGRGESREEEETAS